MQIYQQLTDLIGHTPLLELRRFSFLHQIPTNIIGKLEYLNPLGSVKDRAAYGMIQDGIRTGRITKETTLIEPTSGNTGIGLAFTAASLGLKLILVMPDTMSVERQKILQALGAEIVFTSGVDGMQGSIQKAEELQATYGNALILQQFTNPANAKAHYDTTGPEIWNDTDGTVDIFVSSVGTGGTISGVGKYLKEKNPNIQIVAVEPIESPVLSGGEPGIHGIQGIGAGFVPSIYDASVVDEIIQVPTMKAYHRSRELARQDGVLVGISSGAALEAARQLALRPENEYKRIVALLPDGGERYLSTDLFEQTYCTLNV